MILFLSAYPPRESGLASYTHHLVQAFRQCFDSQSCSLEICALEGKGAEKRLYPDEVRYTLQTADVEACLQMARTINKDAQVRAVCLQHRFGLWGGSIWGENLLVFLKELEKPLAVVFHNVLPEPSTALFSLVDEVARRSDLLITLTGHHAQLLQQEYLVAQEKIRIIPPGTTPTAKAELAPLRKRYKLENRLVLSSYGSLRRSLGIEHALEALDEIRKEHPSVLYLVLGPSHPAAIRHERERYRIQLKDLIFRKGLQKHVQFVNRHLHEEELHDYLALTDVYLHLSKRNVSPMLQAMSHACPVVAVLSPATREFVPKKAGVVVEAQCKNQLAVYVNTLLANEKLRENKGQEALKASRQYAWANVALAYKDLFTELVPLQVRYKLPDISTAYLHQLSTSIGLRHLPQAAAGLGADAGAAYTLEENARGLLLSLELHRYNTGTAHIKLLRRYLNLLRTCQQTDGSFMTRLDEQGNFLMEGAKESVEESTMQAVWALGALIHQHHLLPGDVANLAHRMFNKALLQLEGLQSLRACSFAIKGLYLYHLEHQDEVTLSWIEHLAARLQAQFAAVATREWPWFEKGFTHANSLFCEALLLAWEATGKGEYKRTAHRSFNFLLKMMFMDDPLSTSGNPYLQLGGEERFGFSNEPLDVTEAISALDLFYELSGEELYLDKMRAAFSWFLGNNHLRQSLYIAATGSCCDGLEGQALRHSQGAASLVNYLLARLTLEKHAMQTRTREALARERKIGAGGRMGVLPDRPSMPSDKVKAIAK